MAPAATRDNPLTRSKVGLAGLVFLALMMVVCLASLPFALAPGKSGVARYNEGTTSAARLPPMWARASVDQAQRLDGLVAEETLARIAREHGVEVSELLGARGKGGVVGSAVREGTGEKPAPAGLITGETPVPPGMHAALRELEEHWPRWMLGTDALGRSLLWRVLAGGGISLAVGLLAAAVSVTIGTLYGAIAGMAGGRVDGIMMRIVDVLYGLPYVLLVVLLAVASDAVVSEFVSRQKARQAMVREGAREVMIATRRESQGSVPTRSDVDAFLREHAAERERLEERARQELPARELAQSTRAALDLGTLLVAIGGISWLTMSRVVRGQVMSLRGQPFMEAARALGLSRTRIFVRHLLPNLAGTITVYATLTVPQAILQESFLSFLGIGVKPPLASWGNLAADGLGEINPYQSHWWLPVFPCVLLSLTLLALNFTGEALREALDPKRARRGV